MLTHIFITLRNVVIAAFNYILVCYKLLNVYVLHILSGGLK